MAQCLAPIILKKDNRKTTSDYATDIFPCGKCPNCVKRRVQGWVFRISEEQKQALTAHFITLTYSDENLPYSDNGLPTLDKTDFQKFIKRLRKALPKDVSNPIKYYACGEYGTKTHRPHYHAIIFNLPPYSFDMAKLITEKWGIGQIDIASVTPASIAYVAGYCMKKVEGDPVGTLDSDDRKLEFSLMSKKLGLNYLTPKRQEYYQRKLNPYLTIEDGKKIAMPRYFKDKLFTDEQRDILNEKALSHLEKTQFATPHDENEYKKFQFFNAKLKSKRAREKL